LSGGDQVHPDSAESAVITTGRADSGPTDCVATQITTPAGGHDDQSAPTVIVIRPAAADGDQCATE